MIADILRESARRHGHRPCVRILSERRFSTLTYEEFDRLVDFFAAAVIHQGIEPRQRVCIISENRPEWAISYLGTLRAGCTVGPLDSLSKPEDIRYLVRRSQARMVLSSGKFVKDLGQLDDLEELKPVIVCFDQAESFADWLAGSPFVSEVMVVGAKNPTSGREEVHALIYPDFGRLQIYAEENSIRLDEEQIKEIVRSEIRRLCVGLSDYKKVKNFTIRNEEFPKTSTKKIRRQAVLERASAPEIRPSFRQEGATVNDELSPADKEAMA